MITGSLSRVRDGFSGVSLDAAARARGTASGSGVRDKKLCEDDHRRYREANGVKILATLRSLAINAMRLNGFWSLTEGIVALAHDITGLLRLRWLGRSAGPATKHDYQKALDITSYDMTK